MDDPSPLQPVAHHGLLGHESAIPSLDDLITHETPLLHDNVPPTASRAYAPLASGPTRNWSRTALTNVGWCSRCWMRCRVRMHRCPGFAAMDKWLWFLSGPKFIKAEVQEDAFPDDADVDGIERWLPRVSNALRDPEKRRRCCIRSVRCCCRWIRFPRASFRAWRRRQTLCDLVWMGLVGLCIMFVLPFLLQHSHPALWIKSRTWGYMPMKPYTSHTMDIFGTQYEVAAQCESFLRSRSDVACVSAVELGESYHHVCMRRRELDASARGHRRATPIETFVHMLNPSVTRTNKTVETEDGWSIVKLKYFDVDEQWMHCVYPEPDVPSDMEAKRKDIRVAMQNMTMTNRRDYYRKQAQLQAQQDALDQVMESLHTPSVHRATRQSHVQVSYLALDGSTHETSLYDTEAICVQYYDDVYRGMLRCKQG